MASYYLSPFATFLQLFSETGIPLSGGLCWTYLAGTTTPGPTFTDSTGAFPNSNPIQMGSDGRLQNVSIWQQGGVALKYVFSTNAGTAGSPVFGTQLGPTFDNISGINDPASLILSNTGSFTTNATGFSSTVTATVNWQISGIQASVVIGPVGSGMTSSAVTFTLTNIPTVLIPPTLIQRIPVAYVQNNGIVQATAPFVQIDTTGVWEVGFNGALNGWTASGIKTLGNPNTPLTYLLV